MKNNTASMLADILKTREPVRLYNLTVTSLEQNERYKQWIMDTDGKIPFEEWTPGRPPDAREWPVIVK
jgi:hypothetical protein